MNGTLHTVDPGNDTGLACFQDGLLIEACTVAFEDFRYLEVLSGDRVLIEVPRHYQHNEKGDTNDLIDLALRAGQVKEWCLMKNAKVELVHPRTWKGSVPKKIHNERVLRALKDYERTLLPLKPRARTYDHNMIDAVGLGLWKLGRMT